MPMIKLAEITHQAFKLSTTEFISLIEETTEFIASEKGQVGELNIEGRLVKLKPSGEAIIVGDLHGDFESLRHIIKTSRFLEKVTQKKKPLLIFLGDYGDRGRYSSETYFLVLKLKQLFPQRIVLMRGNHEGPDDLLAHPHDLPENLQRKFGKEGSVIYSKIRDLFKFLYNGVVVEKQFVMIHGGVPSEASSIDDMKFAQLKHPKERHLEEILWSDPAEDVKGTYSSPRGAGRLFGEDVTKRFLDMLRVKMLIRGHESSHDGFKINHSGRILTLFSRKGPPYFNSSAAYLQLDLSLEPQDIHGLMSHICKF
ncbi:MAG: metallophosphoesterase [Candidatus Bathyarchaeota archaeon]|nr:MAG: metallophosphoesterase [Candidatus Bathyarchaeota archaeon]